MPDCCTEKPVSPTPPALSPRKRHAREEGARLCSGPARADLLQSNSSAEDQARRSRTRARVAWICANLPPKLINPLSVCADDPTRLRVPNASPPETNQNRGSLQCAHASTGIPHRSGQLESTSASGQAEKLVSTRSGLTAGADTWVRRTLPCIPCKNISSASLKAPRYLAQFRTGSLNRHSGSAEITIGSGG